MAAEAAHDRGGEGGADPTVGGLERIKAACAKPLRRDTAKIISENI